MSMICNKIEDARREKALSELRLRIVRFRNDEVVRNLSVVVGRIKELVLVGNFRGNISSS